MVKRQREAEEEVKKLQLPKEFFARDTLTVAKDLVGKVIEHTGPDGVISAIISEAEAYSEEEASCHAFKGKTKRNEAMFGEPGLIYLYYIYGKNICINFKTDKAGKGCAVLIRAGHPLKGTELLANVKNKKKLMDGPAKLVKSLRIPFEYYGMSVLDENCPVKVLDEGWKPVNLQTTERIGISQAKELPWRFVTKEFTKEDDS
jgi:DNA-3-methyladenine glycosylase